MCKPMKAGVLPSIDYDLNGRNTDDIASRYTHKLLNKALVEGHVGEERVAKLERRVSIEHFSEHPSRKNLILDEAGAH
jgi:hypothetical protein